jgi:hypothetical protein
MSDRRKPIIAFDLDGIFVDKPPLIPKKMIEWLFRGWCGPKNRLYYRFPSTKTEQLVRQLSHFYLFRPALKSNIRYLRQLSRSGHYRLYLVSSRYSFIHCQTERWLKKRRIYSLFDRIYLNSEDLQPHLFKEKTLTKLAVDYFLEDDPLIFSYLQKKLPQLKVILCQQSLALALQNEIGRRRLAQRHRPAIKGSYLLQRS